MLIPNGVNQWNKEMYELTGYINNVNTQYSQVLMEYGFDGTIGNSYDYGSQRNSLINKGKKTYYEYDGRGSVSDLVDRNGQEFMYYSYGAFGETTISYKGYVDNPYRYNAEYVNDVPGIPDMQYLRARYYAPYEGRFFTQDRLFGETTSPLSQNLYAYCANNPIMNIDPSGYSFEDCLKRAIAANAGLSVIEGIKQAIRDRDSSKTTVKKNKEKRKAICRRL